MASLIFNSCWDDTVRGSIDFDTDTFFVMLVGSSYAEDKRAHAKRSQITAEVSGTGYTAGGQVIVPTVTKDNANDRIDIVFPQVTWPASTISSRKAVYYKRRGGAASADELVGVADFGADVSTTNGVFTLQASTFRLNNSGA